MQVEEVAGGVPLVVIEDFFENNPGVLGQRLPNFSEGCSVVRVGLAELAALCETEGEEAVAGRYLCSEEFAAWRAFRLDKRRLEWLGGRIAVKEAAMRLYDAAESEKDWLAWQIAAQDSGRPVLVRGVLPLPEISISHSDNLAMAMATKNRCGIDVQQQRESLVRVRSRFCKQGEEELLAKTLGGIDQLSRLNMLWSAKEAVRKAVPVSPLPGFEEMELVAVRGQSENFYNFEICFTRHDENFTHEVGVITARDYAVALVAIN